MLLPLLMPAQTPQAPNPPASIEPVRTSITVVENIALETPANVTQVTSESLAETPGVNIDDRLREIPGFSLFRRSSSLVANPTTQGVSLRGVGSSGASRALVLWDGVPMNDPFGGWVYWTRFTPDNLERVEVSRGASTSVFGDLAMGGAIALFSRPALKHHLNAGYQGGNRNTQDVWAGYSELGSEWAASVNLRAFTTDGYFVVPDSVRGRADHPANARFVNSSARVDYFANGNQIFFEGDVLAEERNNGTKLTHNSTGLGTASLHYLHQFTHDGISVIGFRTQEQFHGTFSSVTANRNFERLTFRQTLPADATGGAAIWNHAGNSFNAAAGADVDRAGGSSTDRLFPRGRRFGEGVLLQHGIFAQTDIAVSQIRFFLGARHQFTGQGHQFFSPSAGFVYGRNRWRGRGSVYRAYRAPTLNELYREGRVGNTDILPNPALVPETLFGAEIGADYSGEHSSLRITAFRNSLSNLITNVTRSSTPTLVVRIKENAAQALARGFEINGTHRWHNFHGDIGYLFADSRLSNGRRILQVPKHQGSAQLGYDCAGTFVTVGVRSYASQFDDDLNQFLLPGFATLQLTARQRLTTSLSAVAELENLLDRQYFTGFNPTPTIGGSRLWRVGLRWSGRL